MWYSNRYRRHLCDMHIEDHDDRFLAQFSPEDYVENLKRAHIDVAMLYLQAHTGLCYYPTQVGVMHRGFRGREDMMRRTAQLCHENDIKVVGYYSIIYNTREHDRHPEWRMLTSNGHSVRENRELYLEQKNFSQVKQARYGRLCPNRPGHREFVYAQIDEMLDYFPLDGIFFDMPFWPHPCYCDSCRARWRQAYGDEMPVDPIPGSRDYIRQCNILYTWMGEFVRGIADYVKQKAPMLSVEFNYASGIAGGMRLGCGDEVNSVCDYCGGDLYGNIYYHDFSCKFFKNATRNQPFEYMFTRAKPGLSMHTVTKTPDQMKTAIAVTAAHHGATLVIDAIDPVGTLDSRVYERIGQMFDFQKPYEPYFHGEMIEDIGIYYGIRSKSGDHGESYSSVSGATGIAEMLSRRHIPYGITGTFHHFDGYLALVAPMLAETETEDIERLCEYVRDGGTLYLSGGRNRALIEKLTGGTLILSEDRYTAQHTEEDQLYIAPRDNILPCFGGFNAKYPLPWRGTAPILRPKCEDDVVATFTLPFTPSLGERYTSIHANPPGEPTDIPAMIITDYGKGHVIWSAVPLECGGMPEYGDILLELLFRTAQITPDELYFSTSAPGNVQLTLFSDRGELLLSCVTMSDDVDSYPIAPFNVRVKCHFKPAGVTLLPEGKPVKFTYRDGHITFRTRTLRIFDMYRIEK